MTFLCIPKKIFVIYNRTIPYDIQRHARYYLWFVFNLNWKSPLEIDTLQQPYCILYAVFIHVYAYQYKREKSRKVIDSQFSIWNGRAPIKITWNCYFYLCSGNCKTATIITLPSNSDGNIPFSAVLFRMIFFFVQEMYLIWWLVVDGTAKVVSNKGRKKTSRKNQFPSI